jgi:hypothetical protein
MNTPAKSASTATSIPILNNFWNILEHSQLFELFSVFGSRNSLRFAIHKKTGRTGMIWFSPFEGEWSQRQGLIVQLSMSKEWPTEFKVSREARDAMEKYSPDATTGDYPTIEKIFLPEEGRWAIEQLDTTLLGDGDSDDTSADARLVLDYIHGDGRYMKLCPTADKDSFTDLSSFEQLEATIKKQSEFAEKIFDLWHGPVSKVERARFAAFGRDGALNLNKVDACSPHLEGMRKETTLAKLQVESGETTFEQVMFGPDGFKARLEQIVGYGALHPALRSEHVYDWVMAYFLKRTGY